jgi:hypothetical protein
VAQEGKRMSYQRNQYSPERSQAYLAFIRSCRCCLCGRLDVEAHHPRVGSINDDSNPGMAQKADDRWALPLCAAHHRELHSMSEREFWASNGGIDPYALALRYQVTVR